MVVSSIGVSVGGAISIKRAASANNSFFVMGRLGWNVPSGIPVSIPALAVVEMALLNQLCKWTSVKGLSCFQ